MKRFMSDAWTICKNCFIAMFIESTEEVARVAVKQHVVSSNMEVAIARWLSGLRRRS